MRVLGASWKRRWSAVAIGLATLLAATLVHAQKKPTECPYGYDSFGNCRDKPPVTVPTGRVAETTFTSEPPGAEVRIAGVGRGRTPLKLNQTQLLPGEYEVVFEKDGYASSAPRKMNVVRGRYHIENVTLKRLPLLTIEAEDDSAAEALVYVDDKPVGELPVRDVAIPVGGHAIIIRKSGYQDKDIKTEFSAGVTYPYKVKLEPTMGTLIVEADWPEQPKGLKVYIDPRPNNEDKSKQKGEFIGETPMPPVPVRAGTHIILVYLDGRNVSFDIVDITPGGKAQIKFPIEIGKIPDAAKEDSDINYDMAEMSRWCEKGTNASACVIAGYLWLHGSKTRASTKAESLYKKACELDDADACFDLGYLLKLRRDSEADTYLTKACKEIGDACWYRALDRVDLLPDPTKSVRGRFTREYRRIFYDLPDSFRRRPTPPIVVDYTGWVGVGVKRSVPIYGGFAARFEGPIEQTWGGSLQAGLIYRTANVLALNGQDVYQVHAVGIDGGVGLWWQPEKLRPFRLHAEVFFVSLGLEFYPKFDGAFPGRFLVSASRTWYPHRLELGCMAAFSAPDHEEVLTSGGTWVVSEAAVGPFFRYTLLRK